MPPKPLRISNVVVGDENQPQNEDWLRGLGGWHYPTNLAEFQQAIRPRTLAEFLELPAAQAMPAPLRAEVEQAIRKGK